MTDQPQPEPTSGPTTDANAGPGVQPADAERGAPAREWLAQLQSMIENLATQAAPVAREISAKAAELAAIAAEKAGPLAVRAAEVTADAGSRFAERSRSLATELRKDLEGQGAPAGGPVATEPAPAPEADSTPAADGTLREA